MENSFVQKGNLVLSHIGDIIMASSATLNLGLLSHVTGVFPSSVHRWRSRLCSLHRVFLHISCLLNDLSALGVDLTCASQMNQREVPATLKNADQLKKAVLQEGNSRIRHDYQCSSIGKAREGRQCSPQGTALPITIKSSWVRRKIVCWLSTKSQNLYLWKYL